MKCTTFLIAFYVLITKINTEQVLDLTGEWKFKSEDGKYKDLSATVPGGIYTDLMRNNIIDDIFFGDNDNTTKWIPRTNWTYYTTFNVNDELLEMANINILFEGLDTVATVVLNDIVVGKSENMFVRYIFDVKHALKSANNSIEVRFQSPIEVAAKNAQEQSNLYPIPPECDGSNAFGECHVNMIRKMQASFSWDWGPSFPSVGIWKDVHIEAFAVNSSVIRYVVSDVQEEDADNWILYLRVYFANNSEEIVTGTVSLSLDFTNKKIMNTRGFEITPNEDSEFVYTSTITISKVVAKTWWPNGFGAQPLYNVSVTYRDLNETEESTVSHRLGFRKIELVQDETAHGLTFYLKVNDVPIFMKGSNQIPINILPELGQDRKTVEKLLTDARDSNMNMLRVWGGGVYESDYFYELADKYGILIFQDFMFADALYPATDQFRQNVLEEVRHQVKRLLYHPSIAIFSGNNENEAVISLAAMHENFTQFKQDYVSLYINTIAAELYRITENRSIFVSSSPSNGLETIAEGYIASEANSNLYGDVHYYNYMLDSFDIANYPTPRFASEYGYQSLPSMETLLTATNNTADLQRSSAFMQNRQHHPNGFEEMDALIGYQLNVPNDTNVQGYIYYSQIIQAMSVKIESEHYRAHRSFLDDNDQGYTMGALFWQLNDVWAAPTWAGIDFKGKWKMLQYFSREFFAPTIITAEMDKSGQLQVYTVCDTVSSNFNATAFIYIYNYASLVPVYSLAVPILELEGTSSQAIQKFSVDNVLSNVGCTTANCFFYFKLMANDAPISPDNYLFPSKLKDSNLKQPNLTIQSINDMGNGTVFEIVTKTDTVTLFVWLDVTGIEGRFSENGFMQVTETRTTYFNSANVVGLEDIQNNLNVIHLLDEEIVR